LSTKTETESSAPITRGLRSGWW